MIAFGKLQTLAAFKMLARAKNIDPQTANEVSKQLSEYSLARKRAIDNNSDDPEYNVDEDIQIENYVDEKYTQLIEDSKMYTGIISSLAPHPCARLVYHKDLRREIGLISLKPKEGKTERTICACIEGATADNAGLCKIDLD